MIHYNYHTQGFEVTLVHGEEMPCPICKGRNALLWTATIGSAALYECRDCHQMFGVASEELRTPGPTIYVRLVMRSLGKRCESEDGCGSFGIVWSKDKDMYVCNRCGRGWGR